MKSIYFALLSFALLTFTVPLKAETKPTITKHTVEITAETKADGTTHYHSRVMHDPKNESVGHDKSVESLFSYTPQECNQNPESCKPLKDYLKTIAPYKAPGFVD